MRGHRIVRLRPAGVRAIDRAWARSLVDGVPFWKAVDAREARTPTQLAQAVRDGIDALAGDHTFSAVHVFGGRVASPAFVAALKGAQATKPTFVSGVAATYAAHVPAVAGVDFSQALVVDMGQTCIKAHLRNIDLHAMWFRSFKDIPRVGASSVRTLHFLQGALTAFWRTYPADRILLAMPCTISDDLRLGECTYGLQHDSMFLPDVFAFSAIPPSVQVYVVNDAELAGVRAQLETPFYGRVLALTIGLGPGAALVEC